MVPLTGCAGGAGVEGNAAVKEIEVKRVVEVPRYVLVPRTAPLYVSKDGSEEEGAEAIYFLPPEEKLAADEALKEAWAKFEEEESKREERWQKAEDRRIEGERRRARSAEQRQSARENQKARREAHELERVRRRLAMKTELANHPGQESSPDHLIVLRLVEDGEEWLEVLTIPARDGEAHCYRDGALGLAGLELRFFVRRADVLDVTISEVRVKYSDYTHIALKPGVALKPGPRDQHVALVDGFELPLRVPGNQISHAYQPGRHYPMPVTDTIFSEEALAGNMLSFERSHTLPYNPFFPLYITETFYSGRTVYATTQTPCGRYAVRVQQTHLATPTVQTRDYTFRHDPDAASRRPFVRAGATLYSPAGLEIGRALEDTFLGVQVAEGAGRLCFERDMAPNDEDHIDDVPQDRRLMLCVAKNDAELLHFDVF